MSSANASTYFQETNDRLIKVIKTFAKIGDITFDKVEIGTADSPIPHGNIDLMVTSCF